MKKNYIDILGRQMPHHIETEIRQHIAACYDPDVEIMRDCQDRITYQLCRELFRSGMVYQQMGQRLPGPQG